MTIPNRIKIPVYYTLKLGLYLVYDNNDSDNNLTYIYRANSTPKHFVNSVVIISSNQYIYSSALRLKMN